jgi:hypothetical protein
MRVLSIDHVVLVAESLGSGLEFLQSQLGVEAAAWGRSERHGTHSLALRLGPACYLEVVAIDPDASAPAQPRWHALDEPWMRRTLMRRPRLFAWAIRVPDIEVARRSAAYDAGEIVDVEQAGWRWRQTLRGDGGLIDDGAAPALVERGAGEEPAARLPDAGVEIDALTVWDEDPVRRWQLLASVGADRLAWIEAGNRGERRFDLSVRTRDGVRRLV